MFRRFLPSKIVLKVAVNQHRFKAVIKWRMTFKVVLWHRNKKLIKGTLDR